MVSNYALLMIAVAVVQVSRALPSPLREAQLVCVCLGVLLGGAIMQAVEKKERGPGIPLPSGWRRHRCAGADNCSKDADKDGREGPEVLAFPGDATEEPEDSVGIAILPGNPGIPHFYCPLGERLHAALLAAGAGPATVYCVGLSNFPTGAAAAREQEEAGVVANMDEEAASVSLVLTELRRKHSRRGVVLVGHSLGAWMVTQHLLEEIRSPPSEPLPPALALVLAMPYLEFTRNWSQVVLASLVRLPFLSQLAWFSAYAALSLPRQVKAWIAYLAAGWGSSDGHADIVMGTLLQQPHHGAGVVLLLQSELPRLNPAVTPGAGLQELRPILEAPGGPQVLALYTCNDQWGVEAQIPKLEALISEGIQKGGGAKNSKVINLGSAEVGALVDGKPPPHQFECFDEYADRVANIIASQVAPGLRSRE